MPASSSPTPTRLPVALLALAVAAFAIGSTEFTILGLLPEVAGSFDVSIPTAGLLISGYALGVVVGAPLLTAAGSRLPRRRLLLLLMALFTAGNALAAVAPSYGVLMAARVLSALPHGAFFGVAAVVIADMVGPERRSVAIASMFTGLAMANVVGVPLGTLAGQQLGWRASFWAIAAMGIVALVAIRVLVPVGAGRPAAGLRRELAAFRRPLVWTALLLTTLGFGGMFAVVGYVTPLMTETAGLPRGAMLPILAVLGLGMVAGTRLVGVTTRGRTPLQVVRPALAGLVVALLLTAAVASVAPLAIAMLFVLGCVAFIAATPLQALVMDQAPEAPTLVSAANQGAFNLGNAIGPAVAGLAIDAGAGYSSTGLVGAAISGSGLALAFAFGAAVRRAGTRAPRGAAAVPGD